MALLWEGQRGHQTICGPNASEVKAVEEGVENG